MKGNNFFLVSITLIIICLVVSVSALAIDVFWPAFLQNAAGSVFLIYWFLIFQPLTSFAAFIFSCLSLIFERQKISILVVVISVLVTLWSAQLLMQTLG